jgi:hypothetical protein
MPLLYKPRDPNYGVKNARKRNVIRRKPIHASVLPETKNCIESKYEKMSPGQVVDAAIRLYAECRELSEVSIKERGSIKLQVLNTTVSQETVAYIQFMRGVMTPGELIDAAIMLYMKLAKDTNEF